MKKAFYLIILSAVAFSGVSQTKIDAFVTVTFPKQPEKKETVVKNMNALIYFCEDKTEGYSVQITSMDTTKTDFSFPKNLEDLNKYYDGMEKGFNTSILKTGLRFQKSMPFKIKGYIGRQVTYMNPANKSKVIESRFILLNKQLYSMNYVNGVDFNEQHKDTFLGSMVIDSSKKPSQYTGPVQTSNFGGPAGKWIFYTIFIGMNVFLILYLRKKKRV